METLSSVTELIKQLQLCVFSLTGNKSNKLDCYYDGYQSLYSTNATPLVVQSSLQSGFVGL